MSIVAVEGQGSLLAVAYRGDAQRQQKGGAARGLVTEFSRNSRVRLLRKIARLDAGGAVFITLTYGADYPTAKIAKQHLRALLERFRRAYPKMSAIWRLEFQKRGAPHFHLICFNLPFLPHKDLRRMWGQITIRYASGDQLPFVRIEMIKSRRGVMFYAAKYVAKVDSSGEGSSSVYLTSAHICTPTCKCSIEEGEANEKLVDENASGRFWGVHNQAALPFAARVMVKILAHPGDRSLAEVKRYLRRLYSGVNRDRERGACIFQDSARNKASQIVRMLVMMGWKANVIEC